MTQRFLLRLLYFALALFIAASFTYWLVTLIGLESAYWHTERYSHIPFQLDDNSLRVTSVQPAAAAAGMRTGDVLDRWNGAAYQGRSEWLRTEQRTRPGETMALTVHHANGTVATLNIPLQRRDPSAPSMSEWITMLALFALPSLISLLLGYWVVAARPRDGNAWLLLVLLSFPAVFFTDPSRVSVPWLAFTDLWHQSLQILGFTALFLFGLFFPERWRLDGKAPWLKYVIVAVSLAGVIAVYWFRWHENFHPAWGVSLTTLGHLDTTSSLVINGTDLLCLFLYWVAIFDKLRSASNADARRRMRVLCAGSVLGLGGVLVFIILLPALGYKGHHWPQYTGAVLFLIYPFTLAYVVLVERAMDVRILVRMGTKYALARASVQIIRTALVVFLIVRFVVPMFARHRGAPLSYLALVLAIIGIIRIFTAENSPTSRLGRWIDRRFFREAYDAELVLNELSDQVRRITEPQSLVDTVSRRVGEVLHVPQVALLLDGGRNGFRLQSANGGGPLYLSQNSYTIRNLKRSNGPVTLYRENPDGWFLLAGEEERALLNRLHTEVLLPVPGRDRLMGVMTLSAKRSEAPYTPSDLRLLQNVATQAGFALEISELGRSLASEAAQRERIHREIEIAREVQERLFPQVVPTVPGATLAGSCRPAQGVGGDYYDLIAFDDGAVGLAVGDVSGKGISAALLMASLRASLRGMLMDGPGDLANMMAKVNRLVYEASASNRYATFFFGAYDPRTRKLCYVNAGHNPPVVVRGEERLWLEAGGPVIGLLPDVSYQERSVTLLPGDLVLAYTDGISEAMTLSEEEWGEERMTAAALADPAADAAAVLRHVFAGADAFAASAPQYDDMTLVVLKLDPAASSD